jgi:anti-sigma factor (TIGR02949 family)
MSHEHSFACKDLLGNLSDFIDGELPDEVCQKLRAHMDGCDNCRVVYDTLNRTIYLYRVEAQETSLPQGARERLFETLHLDDLIKPVE